MSESKFLSTAEVMAELEVTEKTLHTWRRRGIGPPFIQVGQCGGVKYPRAEFFEWLRKSIQGGVVSGRR